MILLLYSACLKRYPTIPPGIRTCTTHYSASVSLFTHACVQAVIPDIGSAHESRNFWNIRDICGVFLQNNEMSQLTKNLKKNHIWCCLKMHVPKGNRQRISDQTRSFVDIVRPSVLHICLWYYCARNSIEFDSQRCWRWLMPVARSGVPKNHFCIPKAFKSNNYSFSLMTDCWPSGENQGNQNNRKKLWFLSIYFL